MNRYRAEVIGVIPHGLTHNEVFATFNSVIRENVRVQSVTKRRLAGNRISLIVCFETETEKSARWQVRSAASAVYNFSFDVILREVK